MECGTWFTYIYSQTCRAGEEAWPCDAPTPKVLLLAEQTEQALAGTALS